MKSQSPESALFKKFTTRCRFDLRVDELADSNKVSEGEAILRHLSPIAHMVALDERGKDLSSPDLAALLEQTSADQKLPTFVIGGADGLTDSVRKQAKTMLRFGRVVWPYQLIRGMLAEQIYRAQTILDRHPYHRH